MYVSCVSCAQTVCVFVCMCAHTPPPSALVYRENWPQEGYTALELAIRIEGLVALTCNGRLGGFSMAGKAGFEGAKVKGCVVRGSRSSILCVYVCMCLGVYVGVSVYVCMRV